MEYLSSASGGININIKIPKANVLLLLAQLKSAISSNLGFISPLLQLLDQPPYPYADDDTLLSLPVCVGSSSPVFVMDQIKNKLPIVAFGDFRHGRYSTREEEETCAICLNAMEESHEMRELPNCCHTFHAHCLDSWMDQHHITCPTCRSILVHQQQD